MLNYIDLNGKSKKSNEYPIKLSSDAKPGIEFEVTLNDSPSVGGVLHKESYGLHRQLILKNQNECIAIAKHSAFDFSTRFPYKPQLLNGRFSQANLVIPTEYKGGYNRLIIKVEDDEIISPQTILAHSGLQVYDNDKFNVHQSIMGMAFKTGGSYTEVILEQKRYHIYSVAESLYLVDGGDREDLEIFKQKAEIMRIALAMLSGKFYGGICNYVTSNEPTFQNIEGVWYEIERESVISNRRVIDLQFFRTTFKESDKEYETKYKSINGPVDPMLFSNLCNNLWSKENLRHAAEIVISAMGNGDPVQQGALYSVALETLTEELGKAKSGNLKPITDKVLEDKMKAEMKAVLSGYVGKIPAEGLNILRKKIDTMNMPANQDRLVKTFGLYSIQLSDNDKEAIKNRNNYLHGRSPLNRTFQFELMQISQRLHTLIISLLLKASGYTGHIINLDVMAYINDEEKMIDIAEELNVRATKLSRDMEHARQNIDNEKFNKAKNELSNYFKNYKLTDPVRII